MTAYATYILIALWPANGTWVERQEAAATLNACQDAADAALAGRALPLDVSGPAREARCIPGNIFPRHWDCIEGTGVPEAARCR
jgi:hypothetical protein